MESDRITIERMQEIRQTIGAIKRNVSIDNGEFTIIDELVYEVECCWEELDWLKRNYEPKRKH